MGFLAGIMFLLSLLIHLAFLCLWIFLMYKAYQNELYQAPDHRRLGGKASGLVNPRYEATVSRNRGGGASAPPLAFSRSSPNALLRNSS